MEGELRCLPLYLALLGIGNPICGVQWRKDCISFQFESGCRLSTLVTSRDLEEISTASSVERPPAGLEHGTWTNTHFRSDAWPLGVSRASIWWPSKSYRTREQRNSCHFLGAPTDWCTSSEERCIEDPLASTAILHAAINTPKQSPPRRKGNQEDV